MEEIIMDANEDNSIFDILPPEVSTLLIKEEIILINNATYYVNKILIWHVI